MRDPTAPRGILGRFLDLLVRARDWISLLLRKAVSSCVELRGGAEVPLTGTRQLGDCLRCAVPMIPMKVIARLLHGLNPGHSPAFTT